MKRTKFLEAVLEKMPFLSEAESKETFFRRIASFLPPMDNRYRLIEKAYNAVEEAFQDIKREGGEEYPTHLRATCLIALEYLRIEDYILLCVALLHDVVEDIAYWTIERVRIEFGDEVALYLSYATKPSAEEFPGLTEEERVEIYHHRFELAPREFFYIKLADRFHNLITLWDSSPEKRVRKVEETKLYYLPYARKHLILLHELEAAIESLELEG